MEEFLQIPNQYSETPSFLNPYELQLQHLEKTLKEIPESNKAKKALSELALLDCYLKTVCFILEEKISEIEDKKTHLNVHLSEYMNLAKRIKDKIDKKFVEERELDRRKKWIDTLEGYARKKIIEKPETTENKDGFIKYLKNKRREYKKQSGKFSDQVTRERISAQFPMFASDVDGPPGNFVFKNTKEFYSNLRVLEAIVKQVECINKMKTMDLLIDSKNISDRIFVLLFEISKAEFIREAEKCVQYMRETEFYKCNKNKEEIKESRVKVKEDFIERERKIREFEIEMKRKFEARKKKISEAKMKRKSSTSEEDTFFEFNEDIFEFKIKSDKEIESEAKKEARIFESKTKESVEKFEKMKEMLNQVKLEQNRLEEIKKDELEKIRQEERKKQKEEAKREEKLLLQIQNFSFLNPNRYPSRGSHGFNPPSTILGEINTGSGGYDIELQALLKEIGSHDTRHGQSFTKKEKEREQQSKKEKSLEL